jgi:sugar lactone lactonase YvrE
MRTLVAVISTLIFCVCHLTAQLYVITTVAGGGVPRTPAQALDVPIPARRLAVASDGSIYFSALNCVFRVDVSGILTRVAGASQEQGYSGDGGPAISAQLNQPEGVAVDALGNVYIADSYNNRVRRVSVDGVITTVAGNGTPGYGGDGGPAGATQLNCPMGLTLDSSGNLFITDSVNRWCAKCRQTVLYPLLREASHL